MLIGRALPTPGVRVDRLMLMEGQAYGCCAAVVVCCCGDVLLWWCGAVVVWWHEDGRTRAPIRGKTGCGTLLRKWPESKGVFTGGSEQFKCECTGPRSVPVREEADPESVLGRGGSA